MLSLFKRYRLTRATPQTMSLFTFLTVCERLKPMSLIEFEAAQQSLEFAADWLYQQGQPALNSEYMTLNLEDEKPFQDLIRLQITRHTIPVVMGNCHELILSALPILLREYDSQELGIIHVGHHFELKASLDRQLGSAYHFALSAYSQTRLFYLGVDTQAVDSQVLDYAEDLGCDWLTEQEFHFRHRHQVKSQLTPYIEHCDRIVISIDLASLTPLNQLNESRALDIQMVLRVLRQIILSGKVAMIQLIGAKDKLIYSKQTKTIIDELNRLSSEEVVQHPAMTRAG